MKKENHSFQFTDDPIISPDESTNLSFKFNRELSKSAFSAFQEYFQKCIGKDNIRPITGQCISSTHVAASLYDGLDTLYLLNKGKLFKAAKKAALKHKFKTVNRREFWSTVIGSLISTFLLTNEQKFIKKATELSLLMIEKQKSDPILSTIVSFTNDSTTYKGFLPGLSLTEFTAGIPELVSLYNITGNEEFKTEIDRLLKNIPNENLHSSLFYDFNFHKPLTNYENLDGHNIGFLVHMATTHSINPSFKTSKYLLDFSQHINSYFSEDSPILFPLLLAKEYFPQFNFDNSQQLKEYAFQLHQPVFSIFNHNGKHSFQFGGEVPLLMLMDGRYNDSLREMFLYSFDCTKAGNGFSGFKKTSAGRIIQDDIQHSDFFGWWLKVAALLAYDRQDLIKNAVFNERGHILSLTRK